MTALGIVRRLLEGSDDILGKFEFEKESGKGYSEIEANRNAVQIYVDGLKKYFKQIP